MSYKLAVLKDNPVGFWPLNSLSSARTYNNILIEYATYQDWLNSESSYGSTSSSYTLEDISINGNHGGFTLGDTTFTDVLPLVTLANYDSNTAGCKISSSSQIGISDIGDYYNMFYRGTETLSFGIEFWISFDKNPATDNQIMFIEYGGAEVASIHVKNDIIYFKVVGSDKNGNYKSYTAYKQINTWESQIHVFASYDNGNITISANSFPGTNIRVDKGFIFTTAPSYSDNIVFKFGPSGSNNNFVINNLAFYDCLLTQNQIRNHMVWATNDSKPQLQSKSTDAYPFDMQESESMFAFKKVFSDEISFQSGTAAGTKADNTGLVLSPISSGEAMGTWVYTVPTSNITNISGLRVSWDSACSDDITWSPYRYVKVEYSIDNGKTFNKILNDLPVFKFTSNTGLYPSILIKVTLYNVNGTDTYMPRIDNLFIGVYKDLSLYSDGGVYKLQPYVGPHGGSLVNGSYIGGSIVSDTYTVKSNKFNILARSNNFGINLNAADGSNSVAVMYPQAQSPLYNSVEFWYRFDGISDTKVQMVLDTVSADGSLYFSQQDFKLNQDGFQSVYVNGILLDQPRALVQGETYHIVCVYQAPLASAIFFGGDKKFSQYSKSTYGYITMYTRALSQSDAQNRYLFYLTSQVGVISDSGNGMGSLVEYSSSITSFNNGKAILTYTAPR